MYISGLEIALQFALQFRKIENTLKLGKLCEENSFNSNCDHVKAVSFHSIILFAVCIIMVICPL